MSKSSQGHQTIGPTINSPKYQSGGVGATMQPGSTREHQKILHDIMNMSATQREQKSGSAATSYATSKPVVQMTMSAGVGGSSTSGGGH